jgi:hypothetical protein
MKKIVLLYIASILLTAVFSYSLNVFMHETLLWLTIKTMLIPCFTWSMLMLLAWNRLKGERRMQYLTIAAWVCAIGSAALVPGGIYNFSAKYPDVNWSLFSVIFCVVLMSVLFYIWLKAARFSPWWWTAYNILIITNMTIFYLAARP